MTVLGQNTREWRLPFLDPVLLMCHDDTSFAVDKIGLKWELLLSFAKRLETMLYYMSETGPRHVQNLCTWLSEISISQMFNNCITLSVKLISNTFMKNLCSKNKQRDTLFICRIPIFIQQSFLDSGNTVQLWEIQQGPQFDRHKSFIWSTRNMTLTA